MKITKFNRPVVRDLCEEMFAAVKKVADKHGIDVRSEGASFSPAEATVKFHVKPQVLDDGLETRLVAAYKSRCKRHKLPEIYSIVVGHDDTQYKIEGWNTRAPKYPIRVTNLSTGDSIRMSVEYLKHNCRVV